MFFLRPSFLPFNKIRHFDTNKTTRKRFDELFYHELDKKKKVKRIFNHELDTKKKIMVIVRFHIKFKFSHFLLHFVSNGFML